MVQYTLAQALGVALQKWQSGDLSSAINIYDKILDVKPDNTVALTNSGVIARQIGDYESSVKRLEMSLSYNGNCVITLHNLGATFKLMEEFDKAEKLYLKAISLKNDFSEVYLNLGNIYQIKKRYKKAIKSYENALKNSNQTELVYNNIASIYFLMENYEKAIEYYKKSIDIIPTCDAYINIAETYLKIYLPEDALFYVEKAIELANGFDIRALSYKSICLFELGRDDEAVSIGCIDNDVIISKVSSFKYFDDKDSFNSSLSSYLSSHPTLKPDPYFHATKNGWHTGELVNDTDVSILQMKEIINNEVQKRVDNLTQDIKHPLRFNFPRSYNINIWSVKMGSQGHQIPHIHETAWLSGVYYCQIPDEIQKASDVNDGWIEFGKCKYDIPCKKEHPFRLIKPEEGSIITFPSHLWHRTISFESDKYRICVAFDVVPA